MAINTHQADHVEYIQDSNNNKHYLNAEYLDGHSYAEISNAIGGKGTVTSVATADGITGGTITASGTIKANLKSYTKNTAEIGGKLYGVELDKNGKLAVNVPWTDTNTDTHYTNYLQIKGNGTEAVKFTQDLNKTLNLKPSGSVSISAVSGEITISATDTNTSHNHNVGIGLVGSGSAGTGGGTYTYKAKLRSETALTVDSAAATTTSGRVYPVAVDKSGYLSVNVPWTDTHADISNLVPYTGASKDVDLGNHSLLISDKTVIGGGAKIKISGRYQSEDDTSVTIEPGNITLAGTGDATTILNKSGFKAQLRRDTNGDGQLDTTSYSMYEYGRIAHNGKRIYIPEKNGTIALTSDLSTLLDKGTSSTVVNQIVYNPVEMKKALKVPSIQGENSANNHMNGAPLYSLGSTMATENGQATGSSSLSLTGYTGATGNPYSTTLTQTADGTFRIAPGGNLADTLFWNQGWKIQGSKILTESSISTQQWKLTSTTGTVTTVNICTK